MDVINPELIWIEGMCYRINNFHEKIKHEEYHNSNEQDDFLSECEDDEDNFVLTKCANGRIKTSFHIPQSFFGFIIGAKGSTKKRLENETRTDIKIPPRGQAGDIIITGNDEKGVTTAARRVKMIVSAARNKQRPTHFLSIPVNTESIKENFNKFKEEILKNNPGISPSVFTTPEKLHITILMMHLADNEERMIAKNLLEDAKSKIIDSIFNGAQLNIKIKGISYMNDDPRAVHVLYAKLMEVEDANCSILTRLADELNDHYSKSGLLTGNYDKIKLHITLMNSKHANEDEDYRKRKPFDASNLLEEYSQYEFGETTVPNIHLSQIGSNGPDGYYQSTTLISL